MLQTLIHLILGLSRPLTVGVRGIYFDASRNAVFLVKHRYRQEWAFPGGGVEVGESMLSALEREASEEAGLSFKSALILDAYHNCSISSRDHVMLYILEGCSLAHDHEPPGLEIEESGWFNLNSLPKPLTPCTVAGATQLVARNQT